MHSQDENFLFPNFHTYDYARHFVSACTRILGLEGTTEGVEDQGRLTRVAAVCSSKSSSCFLPPYLALVTLFDLLKLLAFVAQIFFRVITCSNLDMLILFLCFFSFELG